MFVAFVLPFRRDWREMEDHVEGSAHVQYYQAHGFSIVQETRERSHVPLVAK